MPTRYDARCRDVRARSGLWNMDEHRRGLAGGWQRAREACRMVEILNWEKEYELHAERWRVGDERPWELGSLYTERGESGRAWELLVAWDRRWGIDRKKTYL